MNAILMTYVIATASVVLTLGLAWSHRTELQRMFGTLSVFARAPGQPRAEASTDERSRASGVDAFPSTKSRSGRYYYVTTIVSDVDRVIDSVTQLRRDIDQIADTEPKFSEMRLNLEKHADQIVSEARYIESESKRLVNEDS